MLWHPHFMCQKWIPREYYYSIGSVYVCAGSVLVVLRSLHIPIYTGKLIIPIIGYVDNLLKTLIKLV